MNVSSTYCYQIKTTTKGKGGMDYAETHHVESHDARRLLRRAKGEIADFMNALPKIVASRTMEKADWHNTRLVHENVPEEIARLKAETGKDIFIFGSADLSANLIPHGLIDEFRVCAVPTVLGGGSPLFKVSPKRLKLRLFEARPLKRGAAILRYQPA